MNAASIICNLFVKTWINGSFFFFFMDQVLQNHGFFLDVLAKITSRIWDVEQLFQSSLTNVELLQDYSIIMMILKSHHRIINVSSI